MAYEIVRTSEYEPNEMVVATIQVASIEVVSDLLDVYRKNEVEDGRYTIRFVVPDRNKEYIGIRDPHERTAAGDNIVYVRKFGGITIRALLLPDESLKVRSHSPTGFSWGYAGSGPAQLALAILLDFFGDKDVAQRFYQDFKFAHVARWPQGEDWKITAQEIEEWITKRLNESLASV